jgi:uncharacterized membrane protein YqiK
MRIVIIAVSVVAIVVIGITVWFQMQGSNPAPAPSAVEAPRQYDTTGGQEMRPRWDNSGGQGDDAAGN